MIRINLIRQGGFDNANISVVKSSASPNGKHYLLFDGDCGICTRCAQLCQTMDEKQLFEIIPSQALSAADLTRLNLDRASCEGELKIVTRQGRIHGGAFAVNYFLFKNQPWTLLVLIAYLLPVLLLIEVILYRLIARNRTAISRWLGLTACKTSRT